MNKLIECRGLVFMDFLHYPDLTIEESTVSFVSGESGCGKSTLLKLLNGTVSPSSGTILYRGEDIGGMDKIKLRKKLLLAKQVPYLFQGTVRENFSAFHDYHGTSCPSSSEISYFLDLCGIPVVADASCDTMSGGERQRVFLSIALSLAPEVLLLDEPTSSLNGELSAVVMKNIIDFAKEKNMGLIVISHDMTLQETFAEKIIQLRRPQ